MFPGDGVEMTTDTSRVTALSAFAVMAAFGFVLLLGPPGLDASARGTEGTDCGPHAGHTGDEATVKQLRNALGCLIDEERAERDRRELRPNKALKRIARRHTRVMLEQDCFKHECPGERSLRKRIERSDYVKNGGIRYGYGEILGCSRTPAGMVEEWMGIRFSKKNIVDGRFRHIGIGAKRGSPFPRGSASCSPGGRYVTYTVIFAWRKRTG